MLIRKKSGNLFNLMILVYVDKYGNIFGITDVIIGNGLGAKLYADALRKVINPFLLSATGK